MRLFDPTSRLRIVLDAGWVLGFVAVLAALLLRSSAASPLRSGLQLQLVEGVQRRGLYHQGKRLGWLVHRTARDGAGWSVTQRFFLAVGDAGLAVGETRLFLRGDLSLDRLAVDLDPGRLAKLTGGGGVVGRLARHLGRLKVEGRCRSATGVCRVKGRLGQRRISRTVSAGRGPILPSAIYPLLARGALGSKADLTIFDPISMQQRTVTYELLGWKRISLGGKSYEALRVRQDLGGLFSEVWLDSRGRVLKEQLQLGVWVEHEAWSESIR